MAWIPEPGSGGVSDHGDLDGLADDDHTQYLNTVRHAAIDAADHGSGAATAGQVLTADGAGGAAWKDPTGGRAFAETIGDNSNTSFQVQHDLGTQDLVVQLWDLTGAEPIEATGDASQIEIDDDNTITVTFSAAPATDSYRVVILASGGSTGGGGGGGGTTAYRSMLNPTRNININANNMRGWSFIPTIDIDVSGLGFTGNWDSAKTYRIRLYQLDNTSDRNIVATLANETVSPATSGISEVAAWWEAVTLTAGTPYAATIITDGEAANFVTRSTWSSGASGPGLPVVYDLAFFRLAATNPSQLTGFGSTETANPGGFVIYWAPSL